MSARRSEGAPAGRPSRFVVRQFSGPVIYRTVRAHHARTMWQPSLSRADYRWNPTFPAVYTSLGLEVSLAERMKRTAERTTALVVGIGHVVLHRVVDLTNPTMLRQVGVLVQDLLTDDLSEPHRVATAAYLTGVVGLLVPAAIAQVQGRFPRMRLVRGTLRYVFETPRHGVNLVLFPDHFRKDDEMRELYRFAAVLEGLHR